jgi:hypothetical protein
MFFSLGGLGYPDEQKSLPKQILVSGCDGVKSLKRDYGIDLVHENINDQVMMLIVSTDEKTAVGTNKYHGVTIADAKYVNNEFYTAEPGLFQASFLSGGCSQKVVLPLAGKPHESQMLLFHFGRDVHDLRVGVPTSVVWDCLKSSKALNAPGIEGDLQGGVNKSEIKN